MADETVDRPVSEKGENSNHRWSRDGFYVIVDQDVELGRFKKPDLQASNDKYDDMLETLEEDEAEAKEFYDKCRKIEKLAKSALERKESFEQGALVVSDKDKKINAKPLKFFILKKSKASKARKAAAASVKKAQDAVRAHATRDKVETQIKNETVFSDGKSYNMIWSHIPKYAAKDDLFPDKEPTAPLYCKLKFLLTVEFMKTDFDVIHGLCYRIRNSLSSDYRELRSWFQTILNQLDREKHEPDFRRRNLNFYAGYLLRKKHQNLKL